MSAFHGITIYMYFDDHPHPHFHAECGEHNAKFAIDTLRVIRGSLPPRAVRLVRKWAAIHREELQENWGRARRGEPLNQIEPLR